MTVGGHAEGQQGPPGRELRDRPGTRQVLRMISANGALTDMVDAGARVLEPVCGFCVGNGQSPRSGAVSVRGNNRNFEGRSGTQDAQVYLASPESAVAAALTGKHHRPARPRDGLPVRAAAGALLHGRRHVRPPDRHRRGLPRAQHGPAPRQHAPCRAISRPSWRSSWATRSRPTTSSRPGPRAATGRTSQKSSEFVFKNVDPEFACALRDDEGAEGVVGHRRRAELRPGVLARACRHLPDVSSACAA